MTKQRVAVNGGEIAYTDQGSGPTALFVHGVFMNSALWQRAIDGLTDLRRCVAVDLPGHGDTTMADGADLGLVAMADAVEAACQSLDLGPVDLVGNDTGGAVCQLLAARHPERLRTLTLTNCDTQGNLPPANFAQAVELAKAGQLAPVMQQMASDFSIARTPIGLGAGYERPEDLSDETIESYLGPFRDEGRARALEQCIALMDEADLAAIEPQLKGLDVPTLLAWGTGDSFFELSWAEWLRDTIPGATEIVTVDGGKLFWPDERGDELAAILRRFWTA